MKKEVTNWIYFGGTARGTIVAPNPGDTFWIFREGKKTEAFTIKEAKVEYELYFNQENLVISYDGAPYRPLKDVIFLKKDELIEYIYGLRDRRMDEYIKIETEIKGIDKELKKLDAAPVEVIKLPKDLQKKMDKLAEAGSKYIKQFKKKKK